MKVSDDLPEEQEIVDVVEREIVPMYGRAHAGDYRAALLRIVRREMSVLEKRLDALEKRKR